MTRVETHAGARRAVQTLNDRRKVLEPIPDRPPLPRRVLEQHHRPTSRPGAKGRAHRGGDERQRLVFGPRGEYHLDHRGAPYRLDVHHPPWLLQAAAATIERNTMAAAAGLDLVGPPTLLHFSGRQDTVVWAPSRLR